MKKSFFIGLAVVLGTVIAVIGTVVLALMIGFDEGRNYQAYADSKQVDSCNEVIAGWSK